MQALIWNDLSIEQQAAALTRPAITCGANISAIVLEILTRIRSEGDCALLEYTKKFDDVASDTLRLDAQDIVRASANLDDEIIAAIKQAHSQIHKFHLAQMPTTLKVETLPGVLCELHSAPIEKVGLYIPGGSAPLPSTVLMLATPAQIAGCKQMVLCSPPPISDEILYAASLCGVTEIYTIGGAQAIGAMAYGTETVCKVDKIFGPGNAFVTEAKRQVSMDFNGAAMDMPAGPSEVLVIADATANAAYIAADLLSQAEHGPDSQVILVTDHEPLVEQVKAEIEKQLAALPRVDIATKALENSTLIVCENIEQSVALSNRYAPEHLIVQTQDPRALLPNLHHAGSIFLGEFTPESVGDYASGTNHVLPTYGYTRTFSSLSLIDFMRRFTVQELSQQGLESLAPCVTRIAAAEGLDAHLRAVTIRLEEA